jgi:hypothetical protein
MTPDTLTPPLPRTFDLTGLPEHVVRQVAQIVEQARREQAETPPPAVPPNPLHTLPMPADQWLAGFEAWAKELQDLAHLWPPGHVVDDSREAIYGEREDAQL